MTESQTTPEPARPPHTDELPATPAEPAVSAEDVAVRGTAETSAESDAQGETAPAFPSLESPEDAASGASAPASVPAAAQAPAPDATPALDEGTFTELREPRGEGRLALDGRWHQISPKYVVSQTLQNGIFVAIVIAAMLFVAFALHQQWAWWPGGVLIAIAIATQIVLPRQARALGYMLREDDIVFRKGILWQRIVAVPYGRMQLVDITHGPMDRAFGIAKLKMVTAAATTGVEIPGLSQGAAETLRDTLIRVAETRRTGL